jgi:hypothetical protein
MREEKAKKNQEVLTAEPSEDKSSRKPWNLDFHTTKDRIETSTRMSDAHCLVANTIEDRAAESGIKVKARVDKQMIRIKKEGKYHFWLTPPKVRRVIQRFENGFVPNPITFELRFGREAQVTDVPVPHHIKATPKMREAARKAAATRAANKRGKIETTVVTRPRRDGKPGRQVDYVRAREIGGAPFPVIRGTHRRVFGYRGLSLHEFGPEYENWVRGEATRQAEILAKKMVAKAKK